jgi:hypothetical protein
MLHWPWLRRKSADAEQAIASPIEQIAGDTAITEASQDLLERGRMAGRIADILSARGSRQGRVFAIRGAWGNGKSSLKNLVIEKIGARAPTLEFNPWQWGDNDVIARALFIQIAGKLGGVHGPNAARRAAAFRRYGGLLTAGSVPIEKFGRNSTSIVSLLTAAPLIAGCVGLTWPGIDAPAVSYTAIGLAGLAWVVGKTLNHFGFDRSGDSLETVRDEVKRLLETLEQPLIVFVDDVDRLEPEQIRLVIRQIKANASLPKINFVLLFQQSIVEKALESVAAGEGRDYLEKIVQANFDLPPVTVDKLRQIFTEQLALLIDEYATPENGFNETRWGNVLFGGVMPFVRNLRDARRLISSIAIHLEMHKGAHAFEVNLIDFVALEALRVFEPSFHRLLAESKDLLVQSGRTSSDRGSQTDRDAVEALLSPIRQARQEACRELMSELFPPVEWALGGSNYNSGEWTRNWMDTKRVCTTRGFDRYFELQLPAGTISESDFAEFVSASTDAVRLREVVQSFVGRGLREALAFRLDESVQRLPLDNASLLLAIIFENGENLDSPSQSIFNNAFTASWRSALWYLRRLQSSDIAFAAFSAAMATTESLAVPGAVLSIDDQARTEQGGRFPPILSELHSIEAKRLWVTRIEEQAENIDGMLGREDLLKLLYRWKQFDGDDAPRNRVIRVVSKRSRLPELLMRFVNVGTSQNFGDVVATKTETFHQKHFEDFLDVATVNSGLAQLAQADLTAEKQRVIAIYIRHASRWEMQASATALTHEDAP